MVCRHGSNHHRADSVQAILRISLLILAPGWQLSSAARLDDLDREQIDRGGHRDVGILSPEFMPYEPHRAGGSWLSGVHMAICGLRHQLAAISSLKSWMPVHSFQPSLTLHPGAHLGTGSDNTTVDVRQGGGNTTAPYPFVVTLSPSARLPSVSDADFYEDREIVNDIQAMEWCMWPAFLVGGALLLSTIFSVCTSSTPHLQSAMLALRFVGNLTLSAVVLWLLAWAAEHHREDCEKHLALVGMLAFFVEWMFSWFGLSRSSCCRKFKSESRANVVVQQTPFSFRPRSVYLNCLRPTSELFARFTIQSLLMWLYVSGVHKKARELVQDAASGKDVMATRVFLWWILSAGVQLHMTEQMGSGFVDNLNVWSKLWQAARRGKSLRGKADNGAPLGGPAEQVLTVDEVLVRMAMDFVSNLMYYNLMYISVPVLLVASKQPIELVMNAFAVTYILTLDDERQQLSITFVEEGKDGLEKFAVDNEAGLATPYSLPNN